MLIKDAILKLRNSGENNPDQEIKTILNHVLKEYIPIKNISLSKKQEKEFDEIIEERVQGKSLAKIFGYKNFWKRKFITNEHTLDPRPDSETIIEAVLEYFPNTNKNYRILDLGTGTGCLLISLLDEYPNATGLGVDICEKALEVAKKNAVPRCDFIQSDWFSNVSEKFDIIVCNPPYVQKNDPNLNKNALCDPPQALYGNSQVYDKIFKNLSKHLKMKAFFEIGFKQKDKIMKISIKNGFSQISVKKDLNKHDRVLVLSNN